MSATLWYLVIGSLISFAGIARMLSSRDLVTRLIAMNVVGAGSLAIIVALANRTPTIDPVLSALVITGLVITSAFTGVGAVLIRRIESSQFDTASEAAVNVSAGEPKAEGDD